jgi:hypothetical protein
VRTKCLPIVLPPAVYAQLEERAAAFERDALQEARWLLRQALGDVPTTGDVKTAPPEPATA